jgi:hypothetical protein
MLVMALRSNERIKRQNIDAASAFAQLAISKVGGSSVYIAPKKGTKLLDTDL